MKKTGLWFFIIACLILGGWGCARTVTQIVNYGSQMVVEITLVGTMEAVNTRYFMILSNSATFRVPLTLPDNITFEAIEPGTIPRQGVMADYFNNFYSTWSGYVFVEPAGYFTIAGPFTQGQAITREVLATLGTISNKLYFVSELSRIFGNSIPNTIYFDVLAVPWPDNDFKVPADRLTSTNAYISKLVGSTITIDDDVNDVITPSQNIIKCTVTIQ